MKAHYFACYALIDVPELSFGDVVIDRAARSVLVEGTEIELSAKEFDLLCLLAASPGQVFTREIILERVWGWDYAGGSRTVDVHISWLRQKIEMDPSNPTRIITVHGIGYRFEG